MNIEMLLVISLYFHNIFTLKNNFTRTPSGLQYRTVFLNQEHH